jgi:hypothetical protein
MQSICPELTDDDDDDDNDDILRTIVAIVENFCGTHQKVIAITINEVIKLWDVGLSIFH